MMIDPYAVYWGKKLEKCKKALEENNFEVFLTETPEEAGQVAFADILPKLQAKSISWGDSQSIHATGILDKLRKDSEVEMILTFDKSLPRDEIIERRRQALLVDLFLTGTNALTERGQLVNLDMIGNRVGAITFGPKNVIIVVGRNKIVPDVEAAMARIRNYAAPLNAIRHASFKTPCQKTAACMDCKSPDRICNTWTITEKSYPKGRTKIILVNQDLGL
jgi:L-lactate utilization protein LutC